MKPATLLAALLATLVPAAVSALTTTQTLPVGDFPFDAAIDTVTGRIFVTSPSRSRSGGGGSYMVIERDGSATRVASDPSPAYVAVSPALRSAVITSSGFPGDSLTLVNTDTLAATRLPLAIGAGSARPVISDTLATAYVLGMGTNGYPGPGAVTEVDLRAATTRTVTVAGFQPVQLVVNPSRQRAYIAGTGHPGGIALAGTAWIQAYDTSAHAPIGTPTRLPGRQVHSIFAAPDNSRLYVVAHVDATQIWSDGTPVPSLRAAVFVVDPATLAVTATHLLPYTEVPFTMRENQYGILDWPTHGFYGSVVMDPDGSRLYLLEDTNKRLSRLDLATGALSSVPVEGYARVLQYDATSRTLLATFYDGGYMAVFSTDLERLDTVRIGGPNARREQGGVYSIVPFPGTGEVYVSHAREGALVKVSLPPAAEAQAIVNYTDLWSNPSEPGWGLFLDQQGITAFGTLFVAGAGGDPAWLVMSEGIRQPDGSFSGALYRTRGPIAQSGANTAAVGAMRFAPGAAGAATLTYTVDGVTETRALRRQQFRDAPRRCAWTTDLAKAAGPTTNFTALWSNPAEPGWGLSISHQGDTVFGVLYAYDAQNRASWTVMSNGARLANGSFAGDMHRVRAGRVEAAGAMSLQFNNAAEGVMHSVVDGVSEWKTIARQAFARPTTDCRS
jgi:hypothetical protein